MIEHYSTKNLVRGNLAAGMRTILCLLVIGFGMYPISGYTQNGYTTPTQTNPGVFDFQSTGVAAGCADICGDGIDNDGDCLTDCEDNDCGVATFEFLNGQAADWVIGQADFSGNGFGTSDTQFRFPKDVAFDPISQKVFVADWQNNRVLRFGTLDDFLYNGIAEAVFGQPDFVTSTAGAAGDRMNQPIGLFIDQTGTLWVADSENNRVLRFDNAGTKASLAPADGVLGQSNLTSSATGLTQSTMNSPFNVHVDGAGRLYVLDKDNRRILRFDNAAALGNGANASGVLGQTDFTTNVAGLAQDKIGGTGIDLQIICNSLFVSDFTANRIMRWDNPELKADGANADAVLGQVDFVSGGAGSSQTKLDGPQYMTADRFGTLYVSEQNNSRVVAYENAVTLFGEEPMDLVLSAPDFVTVSSTTSATETVAPDGIAIIDNGLRTYLAIVDRGAHRIVVHGDENINVDEDDTFAGVLPGSDPSGSGSLTFALSTQPQAGTVVLDNTATGAFTYTAPGVCDLDADSIVTFTYTVTNGNSCVETGELSILINDLDDTTDPTPVCQDIDVYLDASGNASIVAADVDNGSSDNCGTPTLGIDVTAFTCAELGNNNVTLTATDLAGNDATCVAVVTVIDTIDPVAICQNINAYLDASGNVTILAADVNNGSSDNCGTPSLSLNDDTFDCTDIGASLSVTLTATDGSTNTGQCVAQVTVLDTISPIAACQNINVYLDAAGNASIVAADVDNSSSDNCGSPNLGIDIDTFDCSNVGTPVTVTLTVTDGSSNSDQCTATVTVLDTISPSAICQDINVYLDGSGNASIVAADVDNGSGDNCGASPALSIDINTFDCTDLGAAVDVTLTVNDGSQIQQCVSSVTVLDTISPNAACQNINVILDGAGNGSIVAADIDNGSSDNCGSPNLTLSVSSFTCADVGTPVDVTLFATDGSGNIDSCIAQVTVVDNIDPTAVCQNINAYVDASGSVTVDPADVNNGSTDNCGTPNFSLNSSVFNCTQLGANAVIFTATDAGGNDAVCPAVITVIDTISPNALCMDISVNLGGGGTVNITGAMIDGGSTDNCSVSSLATNPSTLSTTGVFPVWLIVTDGSGNQDSCQASVTVNDNVDPTAVCQDIDVYLDGSGNAVIASSDIDGGSTDNGTIVSILASDTTFTCADLGTNNIDLVVVDNAGNDDTCTAVITVIDTISPTVVCQNINVYLDGTGAASIVAADVDNGSTDNCGTPNLSINVSTFNCLNQGTPVSVTLTATDASGNTNNCVAFVTVLDTIAPVATCQDVSVYLNATGNVNITAADIDNGSSDNCGVSQLNINVSAFDCSDVGTPVTVTMEAVDDAGNSASCSATVTVLDTISPTVACQNINAYLDAAGNASIVAADVDNGSGDNCSAAPALSVDIDTFDCTDIGTPVTVTLSVDDGNNVATCTSTVTVLDTIAPSAVCQNIDVFLNASGNASIAAADIDNGSSDNCGILALAIDIDTFDCTDVGTPVAVTLTVTDDSGNMTTCVASVNVRDTIIPDVVCQDINVYLDATGNASIVAADIDDGSSDNCGTPALSIDISTFDCSNVGTPATVTLTANDGTNNANCTAAVTVLDTISPVAVCTTTTISLNSGGTATLTPAQVDGGSTDNCSITSSTVTPDTFNGIGTFPVTLVVTDPSGNQDSCTVVITVDDSNAPVAVCNDTTLYLDNLGNVTINSVDLDGGSTDNGTIVSIIASDTNFTCADIGTTSIELVVFDDAGNSDTCFALVTVLDTIAPTVACQNINVYLDASGNAVIDSSDIDNGSSDICGLQSLTLDITSFDCSDLGTSVSVMLTATDSSGNASVCSASVTVLDTILPTVICQDLNVYLDATGNATIAASDVDNGSGDNCATAPVLSIDSSAFDCTNLGTPVLVTLTVDDGNNLDSCTATITVLDTISPTVVCQDLTVYVDASGNASIVPADVDNGSSDNCGVPTLALDVSTFDCSNLGTPVSVILTATDGSGNTSSCSASVTVLDTITPTALCQDVNVYLDQFGLATILPADLDNGSSDNCGTPNLAVSVSSFGCSNVGTPVSVTLTVTDATGNSAQCVANVTVLDTVSPGAFCQDINVYLDASGNATIVAADVDNGSGDNCGSAPALSVDIDTFDCSDVGTPVSVTLSVDDGSNVTTCTSQVTVLDTISPTVVCQDINVFVDASGNATIVAADIDNGSTDNCTSVTLGIDIDTFDCTNVGTPVSVTLTGTDPSGNASSCTATVTVLDTISPVAVCVTDTISLDGFGNATLIAANVDGGSSDNCAVDQLTVSPNTFTSIGTFPVWLVATDVSSNVDSCQVNIVVVDNNAPTAVCNDTTLYLDATGNVAINSIDLDGGSTDNGMITSILASDTTFDCSQVGVNMILLTVTDDGGNSSQCIANVTVLDTISPVAVCVTDTISLDGSGNATLIAANVDGGSSDNCAVDQLTVSPNTFTSIGTFPVWLVATDASNNVDSCQVNVVVVDNNAPTAVCNDTTLYLDATGNVAINSIDLDGGSTDNGTITNIVASDTTFDCSQVGVNNITLSVTDNGGNTTQCNAQVTVLDTISPTVTCQDLDVYLGISGVAGILPADVIISNGDNCSGTTLSIDVNTFDCTDVGTPVIVTSTVTDASGNATTCTSMITVLDTIAPTIICTTDTLNLGGSGSVTVAVNDINNGSFDNCITIAYTISGQTVFTAIGTYPITLVGTDPSGNQDSCMVNVVVVDNNAPIAACNDTTLYVDASGNVAINSLDLDGGSTDNGAIVSIVASDTTFDCAQLGNNTVVLTVTDNGGNTDNCNATVTVLDTIAPVAVCMTDTVNLSGGSVSITGANVDGGSTDNCSIASLQAIPSGPFTAAGTYNIDLVVTDQSGNTDTCSTTLVVTDNAGPTALCNDTTLYLDAQGNTIVLSSMDLDGGSFDNAGPVTFLASDTTFDCTNALTTPTPVILTVFDLSGNADQCVVNVTVLDTISPVLICQSDTVLSNDPGNCGAIVNYTLPTVSDNCAGAGAILTSGPATGSAFPIGTTTIEYEATDASGNTSTCSFTVTVQDTEAPVAICQTDTLILSGAGLATLTPGDVDGGSTDNCGIVNSVIDTLFFTAPGTYPVQLTVFDAAGNFDTCDTVVVVLDNTSPIALCSDTTLYIDGSGSVITLSSMDLDGGSFDNGSITSIVASDTLFDCSDVGSPVSVTLTVTDAGGNVDQCTAIVTVLDTILPILSCQPDTVYLDGFGSGIVDPAALAPGATDNCGSPTLSVSVPAVDCTNIGTPVSVTVTAIDGQNSVTCNTTVTVLDTIAPVVNCMNITVVLGPSGTVTIVPADIDVSSTDNCSLQSLTISQDTFTTIGDFPVTLVGTDQSGNVDSCSAVVTVILFNVAPVILDNNGNSADTLMFSTEEDTPILICLPVIDGDLDAVDVTAVFNGPSNGLISGLNDGDTCFTYTPFSGFLGTDLLHVIVCDTVGLCDTVVVVIDVIESLDPPIAVDDTATVDQNGSVIIDNEGNDSDPNGDPFSTVSATANNGLVTINGDGTITYTPNPDYCGMDLISYTICDSTGLCADAFIDVEVICDDLIIPQGFSPDNDLIADTWVIEGLDNYPNNSIKIFNRWGSEVFAASPYMNDWDGKSTGQLTWQGDLPEGTYYFILELDEETEAITGFVYIKRIN